ncbi:MAG: hypothetical protein RL671_1684 [Pseudomonadota bacterium]|jgi:uncharacterized protein (TIGR02001 family)
MLTSVRSLVAATLLAGSALAAAPALADETDPPADVTVTGNVALVTDYRFRGISLSGGDVAIQGSINVNHSSGLYAGTWASSLEQDVLDVYGSSEVDLYAGWTGKVSSALTADVGLLYYVYPAGSVGDGNVFEPYASLTAAIGPASAKFGLNYAWKQDSLGGDDNLYLYSDWSLAVPNTPVTVTAHAGYTDGALSPKRLTAAGTGGGWDYSLSASATLYKGLSLGVAYIGVDGASIDSFSNDAVVATLKYSF